MNRPGPLPEAPRLRSGLPRERGRLEHGLRRDHALHARAVHHDGLRDRHELGRSPAEPDGGRLGGLLGGARRGGGARVDRVPQRRHGTSTTPSAATRSTRSSTRRSAPSTRPTFTSTRSRRTASTRTSTARASPSSSASAPATTTRARARARTTRRALSRAATSPRASRATRTSRRTTASSDGRVGRRRRPRQLFEERYSNAIGRAKFLLPARQALALRTSTPPSA